MTTTLRGARLVDPTGRAHGELVDVVLDADGVAAVDAAGRVPSGSDIDLDVDGRWLSPGLWDGHTHLQQWALARLRLDVSAASSAAHAAEIVAARLAGAPPPAGTILVGYGFRDATWPDAPSLPVLDAVAGDVPVVLVSGDLHCGWFSSAALRALQAPATDDGVLRETEYMRLQERLDAQSDEVRDAGVADALRVAAARGVVGVVDLEIDDALATWARRSAVGYLPWVRVRAGVWPQFLDGVVAAGLRTGDALPATAAPGTHPLVTQGPLKVVADGSLNTRTAYCHEPYPGVGGRPSHGVLTVAPEELASLMARAHAAGLACAIHAIGDAANTIALDAFAATGAHGTVEHAQLLTADDVHRFADLGVVASVQPEHAIDDREVADSIWSDRSERAFALADLHAAGVELRLGSDAPVAPLDPWISIAAAVRRTRDERPAWHPEQQIDVATALRSSTDGVERVAPGGPADLVLLETDPLAADPQQLRSMPVSATCRAGTWTHVDDALRGVLPTG